MDSRRRFQLGILGQTLLPLAVGTALVVAAATAINWWQSVRQARGESLAVLARQAEARAWREQQLLDRVSAQVLHCGRVLAGRIDAGVGAPAVPLAGDGAFRSLPQPGGAPVAVFLAPGAASDRRLAAAAAQARDLLLELGPMWAERPDNLTIAAPGRFLAGWGPEAVDLVETMLPEDPVLLPAERAGLGGPGTVRWSRTYLEPASGRWRIAATATIEAPGLGRIAIIQVLPLDGILARATDRQDGGNDTVVFADDGRILASTRPGFRPGDAAIDPVSAAIMAAAGRPESGHAVLPLADGTGWVAVSRCLGPGWTMATLHPVERIEAQARQAARSALLVGVALILAQAGLLLVVLRIRVARPLRRLSAAARALADGRDEQPPDTGRADEVGELARSFSGMAGAVRERERALRAAAEALREREQMARALVESAADAVVIVSDGAIAQANPRAHALFGADEGRLLGLHLADLSPPAQVDGESTAAYAARLVARAAAGEAVHAPWRHRRQDGREFDAEVGLARIDVPGPVRLVAVIRDVTERNRLEERLRQGQKLESLGQLAGGIAHDFNNMLAGIMGSAEMLRRLPDDAERRGQLVEAILTASERAAGLTGKLLTFARKGGGQPLAIDAHQVVRDTVALLERSIDRRIRIRTALTAARSTIRGDPAQLQNALLNLGVNARDAMPDGGELLFATAICELAAEQAPPLAAGLFLEIAVSDTGCGIPPEVLPRIFEPFFTTKPVGRGTGLGLAAVWGTMQEHQGSVGVASTPGAGTTFRLLLPLAPETADPRAATRTPPHAMRRTGRGTVLVVDDEDIVRTCARHLLMELGWSVLEARDGQEGVEVFARERQRITLVLIDMEMPRLRGSDCLRRLLEIDPGVRAVLCSGFAREAAGELARDLGFRAQVAKPYRLKDLDRALDEALAAG